MDFSVAVGAQQDAFLNLVLNCFKFPVGERTHIELEILV